MEEEKSINHITLVNPNDKKIFKEIGYISERKVKVYFTERDFYKHQYNLLQAYYFEESLINLLKERSVEFILIKEIHNNKISDIKEVTKFLFPINLFETVGLERLEHDTAGFDKQIGIPREILLNFKTN